MTPATTPSLLRKLHLALSPARPDDRVYHEALRLRGLLDVRPDDRDLAYQFEHAALAAGRIKMAAKRYEEACEVWSALRCMESSREKAERNLAIASLKGARDAEGRSDDVSALRFWRYLMDVEAQSEAASQGITRSTRAIILGRAKANSKLSSANAEVATDQARTPTGRTPSLLRRFASALAQRSPNQVAKLVLDSERLEKLLDANPSDVALQRKFERAALLAGRMTITSERYEDACRILSSLHRVPSSMAKANRDLAIAALRGGRKSEAEGRMDVALQFWQYLKLADPQSHVAIKGIARCKQNLP